MKHLLYIFLLIIFGNKILAQNYPVQATPLLQPPYSLALNDYQGPASKLRVQLLLRDLTKPSLEVYISLRLSGFGVELQTNPSVAALNTFVLQPGVPLTISGSELSPLFAQMLAQGVNYDELLAGASLPGGYYTWEVVAYLPDGRQVSNTGRASMSVFKAQPPQITFPANQATVAATGIGSVPFQWISRSTSPASVLGTIYDLKIYELPDEVTDPNVAVLSGLLPVFNTQTASTSYFYGPGDPLLQPGKRYAIVVQAQDIGGGDSYENQGLSQVVAFKVAGEADAAAQAACPAPTGLSIRQDDDRTLEVSWNPVAEATDYLLQFRKANQPWQSQSTTDNGLMLIQLSPAKYEVQVATRCNGGLVSTVSPIVNYEIGIAPKDSTADEIEDVLSYYNEDEEPPEPAKYEEAEETFKDPLDDLILTVTYTDTTGKERTYTSLPPNPTTEQLKQATVAIKPQCVALSTGYSCGIHDNPAAPTGAEYMPKAGDELAMGSTMMEVVKIDGSGNGLGIATVKAFNNAKYGVEFKGIKVKEGGCIYAGEAVTKSLDFALLSRTQREELEKYHAVYNAALNVVDSLAPEIAKGMNTLLDALKSKKAATRLLLEENDLTKLPEILTNCTDIATQSQATQDSLQKLYCGLQAGTIKGYKKADIKAALNANIEFMNKLGPAMAECQSTSFTPWAEKPCGGPCAFEFERYVVDEECMKSLKPVFGVSDQSMAAELLLNIKPSEDPISEAQLRDALLFGTTFKTAAATINGEVVEYEYNVWNSINVLKYKGETYWYADNEYYTLGTCVQNSDPNTARPAFKKCINPKPNNTCSYECIDMELGTSIGVQAADMIAKTFTKSLELMLIAYTAPTTTLAAAEGSLDLFAEYLLNEKPEWAIGTTAVVIGLNVYLASKGKPKITNETQEALIKTLEKSGTSLYFKNLGNKFTDYWVQAYSAAKKKVGRWRVSGAGSELLIVFKNKLVARVQSASGFALKHTDAEIIQIINKGKSLNLTDDVIEDMLFISCRDAKPIASTELMSQMDNWVEVVSKRGFPYKFTDIGQFNSFKNELKAGLNDIGVATSDVRIQGSALRTPNANDVDLAAIITETYFDNFLVNRFSTKITKSGNAIDLTNKTKQQLIDIANDYNVNPALYNNQTKSFSKSMLERKVSAYSNDKIIPGFKELYNSVKSNYPNLNIENITIQTSGGNFDLKPFIKL